MATARVLGTETEFGITVKSVEPFDPVATSILLVNGHPSLPVPQAVWDYENENPLLDMRGFEVEGERERPDHEYNKVLNKLLANGGRLYVDGAHPEYSTPECRGVRALVTYEKAGERILDLCRVTVARRGGGPIHVYKNNTDGKGNSYGYHENYLIGRWAPFDRLVHQLVPFLVTRQIFAGAGWVATGAASATSPYRLSQRADFCETLVDINTMVKRPIINTRDEPHADPSQYRRLHVIVGDSNMSEYATYLKVGTTSMVLTLIEEGLLVKDIELEDPVQAIKMVSRDPTLKQTIRLANGRQMTAIEIQREYLDLAARAFARGPRDHDPEITDLLERWARILDCLDEDPMQLSRELDWVIKRELITSFMERKRCNWEDPRVALIDLQYHDCRRDKGLYYTLERGGYVERLVTDAEIEHAMETPPSDTRAYFRAMCLKRFPGAIHAASWTSVMFDLGQSVITRVPLMIPDRGTEALTKTLFESVSTPAELLARLVK